MCPTTRRMLPVAALALCAAAPALCAAAPAQGQRMALLIGIDEYRSPTLAPLRGAVNDTEAVAHVLVTRFGFAPADIRTLTNGAATRAAILAAVARLVTDAGPADTVYLHYSGHGSQVPDQSGDEEDALDETLVPHDGRTEAVPDIVDDELDAILGRLRARHALVVLDSCHSGTATRDGSPLTPRRVPPDPRSELYLRLTTREATGGERPWVQLAASAPDEPALDGPLEGRPHGVFTYALVRTLGTLGTRASPRLLLAGVEREYRRIQGLMGLATMPRPQLEAPRERLDGAVLPPAGALARVPWLRVLPGRDPGEVLLEGGAALGAGIGSAWAIHPPLDVALAPGRAIAVGEVVRSEGRDACLRLAPGRSAAGLTDCRAVLVAPARPEPVTVRLVGGPAGGRRLTDALRSQLGRVARLVGDREQAGFAVTLAEGALAVLGGDGRELLATETAPEDLRAVARVLGRSGVAAELLALDHPASGMTVSVWPGDRPRPDATAVTTRGIKVVGDAGPTAYRIRRDDEPRTHANSLLLNLRAGQECYVTVVDVDAAGGVGLLFPNEVSEATGFLPEGRIPAEQDVRIPDSLAEDNAAGFWFDYCEPPGTDTVRVFAAADLATAEAIRAAVRELAAAAGGEEGAGERVRASLAELRSRLLSFATRGVKVVPAQAAGSAAPAAPAPGSGDWTAASIHLTVREAR